jgi:adenylate cyclase class IV
MGTGRNVEVKARLHSPDKQARLAEKLADGPAVVLRQEDTFYRVASGRLKLREFGDGSGELISYRRPDGTAPKCSCYSICPTATPRALNAVLTESLGVVGIVRKVRRLLLCGQTRIHLDEVEGLGHFVELEVVLEPAQTEAEGEVIARRLMTALAIGEEDLLESAYVDLLAGG